MSKNTILQEVLQPMQENIQPLDMNGLKGRMLRLPAAKKKFKNQEILLLYGSHASIERVYGIAEFASSYGNVTVPDLPGLGGMDSLAKNGQTPDIDGLADYLAAFIKLRYKRKKVTILAISLSFAAVTRMLQRYPDLRKKVKLLVSLAGFSNKNDFMIPKNRRRLYILGTRIFDGKIMSWLYSKIALQPLFIRLIYTRLSIARKKLDHLSDEQRKISVEFEVKLWKDNDAQTYMTTVREMLTLDNCQVSVPMTVHHVSISNDQYFDKNRVEQHLRIIFDDYIEHQADMPNHAPSILADAKEASSSIPESLRKVLEKEASK